MKEFELVYLDYAATSPVAAEVLQDMLPYFSELPGNASSRSHPAGWAAKAAVARAASALATVLAVAPEELTWTSGSTEALNLAIKGVAERYANQGMHLVTCATEHSAVLDTYEALASRGYEVTVLQPGQDGTLDVAELEDALRPDTVLCSVMWGNNETGVLHDLAAIAKACRKAGTLLLCDATQAVGKVPVHPRTLGIDLLACSGHKFGGPKGIGVLWRNQQRQGVVLSPQLHGGGQQEKLRPGTLDVPGIVGMGSAAKRAAAHLDTHAHQLSSLRDNFEAKLLAALPETTINGGTASRLPHISSITFRFVEAEALLSRVGRRLALSTGSACASGDLTPSHVLLAMALPPEDAKSTIRVSLGPSTTAKELAYAAQQLIDGVEDLRSESPVWELFLDGAL